MVLLSFLFFCRQACYLETRTSGAPIAVIWKPSVSVYNVTIHFWLFEPLSFSKRTYFYAYMSKLEIHPIAKRRLLILSAASPTCALVGRSIACATMAQCHRTLVRIFTFHNQEAETLHLNRHSFKLQKYKYVHNLKDADYLLYHHNQRVGPLQLFKDIRCQLNPNPRIGVPYSPYLQHDAIVHVHWK